MCHDPLVLVGANGSIFWNRQVDDLLSWPQHPRQGRFSAFPMWATSIVVKFVFAVIKSDLCAAQAILVELDIREAESGFHLKFPFIFTVVARTATYRFQILGQVVRPSAVIIS